jgi:hypothetical protein
MQQENIEGIVNSAERVYYFKFDVEPRERDRIYEYDPRLTKNQTVWTIDQAVPMRGAGGEVVYHAAGVSRVRPN